MPKFVDEVVYVSPSGEEVKAVPPLEIAPQYTYYGSEASVGDVIQVSSSDWNRTPIVGEKTNWSLLSIGSYGGSNTAAWQGTVESVDGTSSATVRIDKLYYMFVLSALSGSISLSDSDWESGIGNLFLLNCSLMPGRFLLTPNKITSWSDIQNAEECFFSSNWHFQLGEGGSITFIDYDTEPYFIFINIGKTGVTVDCTKSGVHFNDWYLTYNGPSIQWD